jgi:hypothetical protein
MTNGSRPKQTRRTAVRPRPAPAARAYEPTPAPSAPTLDRRQWYTTLFTAAAVLLVAFVVTAWRSPEHLHWAFAFLALAIVLIVCSVLGKSFVFKGKGIDASLNR